MIRRGQAGYEQARVGRIFNDRRADRCPAAILHAADADDVAAGVRLARAENLTVSVRSGGHSWAAWSLRDDALPGVRMAFVADPEGNLVEILSRGARR